MPEAYEELVREVVKLVGENAPRDAVMAKAREAKAEIADRVLSLSRSVNTLDHMITWYAPDEGWQFGWFNSPATPAANALGGRQPNRSSRALEIAEGYAAKAAGTVYTKDVAGQLQAEGDTISLKSLSTAVGNVLTSSGRYSRVRRGEYLQVAPVDEEVVG